MSPPPSRLRTNVQKFCESEERFRDRRHDQPDCATLLPSSIEIAEGRAFA